MARNFNEAFPINSPSQSLVVRPPLSEVPESRSPSRLKRKGSALENNRIVSEIAYGVGMASESLKLQATQSAKKWLKPAVSSTKLRDRRQTSMLPPHHSQSSVNRPPAQMVMLKCQNFRKPHRASAKIGALYVPRFSLGCLIPHQPVFCVTGSVLAELVWTALKRNSALPLGTFAWDKDNDPYYLTSWTVSSLTGWLNNNPNNSPRLPVQPWKGSEVATGGPNYPARANDPGNDINSCGNNGQSLNQAFTTAAYVPFPPPPPPPPPHSTLGSFKRGNWVGLTTPRKGNSMFNSQQILKQPLTYPNAEPLEKSFTELLSEELDFGDDDNRKVPIHTFSNNPSLLNQEWPDNASCSLDRRKNNALHIH